MPNTAPRLSRSIPFWVLVGGSVVAIGAGTYLLVDKLGTFRERAGLQRVYLQVLDLSDLDQLDLVASEVAAKL